MKEFEKASVAKLTTFQVGGIADRISFPTSQNELINLLKNSYHNQQPWYLIGGGSNLLVSSLDIPGNVICTVGLNTMKVEDDLYIVADAGVRLPRLSAFAAKHNLTGMEFWEGIPGTVGGSVIMNAGAHGSSTNKIITSIEVYDLESKDIITLLKDDIKFGYRISSINPKKQVILNAKFKLSKGSETEIRKLMKLNNLARTSSQPIKDPSAGCTFSNPIELNLSAGKLIEELGGKNWSIGNAQVSCKHANFIINTGHAKSQDVCKLIMKLQKTINEKHHINLKPEVKPLGLFTKEESSIWDSVGINESNSFIKII